MLLKTVFLKCVILFSLTDNNKHKIPVYVVFSSSTNNLLTLYSINS